MQALTGHTAHVPCARTASTAALSDVICIADHACRHSLTGTSARCGTVVSGRQARAPVGPVGGAHDDDVRARLQAVHQRQQLRHDAPLHLALQPRPPSVCSVSRDSQCRALWHSLPHARTIMAPSSVVTCPAAGSTSVIIQEHALQPEPPCMLYHEASAQMQWHASTIGKRARTCVFSRLGAMESISSMKMMAGAFFSASSNALRRLLSLSPASLRHDLGAVDQEEEGARLVRHRARDQRLACAGMHAGQLMHAAASDAYSLLRMPSRHATGQALRCSCATLRSSAVPAVPASCSGIAWHHEAAAHARLQCHGAHQRSCMRSTLPAEHQCYAATPVMALATAACRRCAAAPEPGGP